MFEPLPEQFNYPDLEQNILEFWEQNEIFQKSLKLRDGSPVYSFYEGPPTVNGKPGIHHVIARTIKDTVCRFKTMTGHFVRRQAGWDTHGLPVEIAVEKQLELKDKSEVEKLGVENFNRACKEFVYKNIEMDEGWRTLTTRMGYWIDLDSAYITCTNNYIESLWWALKTYFDKGLIYNGFKVVPQSPTIETPLSSHELSQGYKDVRDPNCYLKLKIINSSIKNLIGNYILVWTTTPWTLFSNVALAVGDEIDYVLIKNIRKTKETDLEELLVLAESRLSVIDGEYEIISKFKGSELIGTEYEQILQYCIIDKKKHPNALTVLAGDFVSTGDGSGIVHLAPAFGEDDYQMSKLFNLPFLQPVTPNGHFTDELGEFAGRAVKTFKYEDRTEEGADKDIIFKLKTLNKIYRSTNDYTHSYPHCWRTGNPIIYYARESWFIKSPEYKDEMLKLNATINWQPEEIGIGRFGNWLEEVKEWSLSRDRFWGTPLPIWVSEDKKDMFAIGSIQELSEGIYQNPDGTSIILKESDLEIDLHRPFVDRIIFKRNGKTYRRVHEVIDVWFDSGAMPFAQFHYPFENKELFEQSFPADFIAEGIDQTRGWFYTLHNIATVLFGKPAFKNIVVNDLILDKLGKKMSKKDGNTVDPFMMMNKYGADAIRWYFFVNNPPWKPTLFNPEDIERTILSDFFRSLTNSFAFFALYANIDGFDGTEAMIEFAKKPEIDKWLISRVNSIIQQYRLMMEEYELTKAHRIIQEFVIYELSNWYIRRNRRRFWKGDKDADKISAYQTLHWALINILAIMAPAAPFLSEDLYQRLRFKHYPESIHLFDMPSVNHETIDQNLERKMEIAQKIVFLARSLREKSKLRVRQPLSRILIPVINPQERRDIQSVEEIIKEELNIKKIEYVNEDEIDIVNRRAKGNFKVLGKKYGKSTQTIANLIKELTNEQIRKIEKNHSLIIINQDEEFEISIDDIEVFSEDIEGWLVATDNNITVALDTQLTPDLVNEGMSREFVNRVQNLRKTLGFDVVDHVKIELSSTNEIIAAILSMESYIKNETLADEIIINDQLKLNESEINGFPLFFSVEKK
ncbi:MAG: isoleucine--tRNA ligase [Candidatus Kapabacteria bacterium]|nr:isoleucine--tRNA ligase [Candidatus Kapabacteria bacterium]